MGSLVIQIVQLGLAIKSSKNQSSGNLETGPSNIVSPFSLSTAYSYMRELAGIPITVFFRLIMEATSIKSRNFTFVTTRLSGNTLTLAWLVYTCSLYLIVISCFWFVHYTVRSTANTKISIFEAQKKKFDLLVGEVNWPLQSLKKFFFISPIYVSPHRSLASDGTASQALRASKEFSALN